MDENIPMDEIYEYIHEVSLIDKAQKPLYKDTKAITFFAILSVVIRKVVNGISNTCMT